MKQLFLPYELAVIAKEKGFDEECFGYYLQEILHIKPKYGFGNILNAPLYQQIVDWFREKHNIWIYITFGSEYLSVWKIKGNGNKEGYEVDYYKAFNKAIEESFKLI